MAQAAAPPPLLTEGDPFPGTRFVDHDGKGVMLYHQRIAGDPVVLVLCPAPGDAAAEQVLRQFAALHAQFTAQAIHLFVITAQPAEANRALARRLDLPMPVLSDSDAGSFASLGVTGDPVASLVLAPNLRIETVLRGPDQAPAALTGAAAFRPSGPLPVIRSHAPVLLVDRIFPPDYCDALIDLWHRGSKDDDQVTGLRGDYAGVNMKRRTDHFIRDAAVSRQIQAYFKRRLVPEMARAFNFLVTEAEVYRIGCYTAEQRGHFKRHRDTGTRATEHRRFALSLNLNTGAYDGGQLWFPEFGAQLYEPPRGGGVVFSCALLHEALPVTSGRRFALFTFFSGRMLER